jgi:hypothetical protein
MGMSFENTLTLKFENEADGVEWVKTLPERLECAHYYGDGPKWIEVDGCYVEITSEGYGVYDLNEMDYPDTLIGCVSQVRSLQGDDIYYNVLYRGSEMRHKDIEDDLYEMFGYWDTNQQSFEEDFEKDHKTLLKMLDEMKPE